MKFIDRFNSIKSTKIHSWTVLNEPPVIDGRSYLVTAQCDCGKRKQLNFYSLLRGDTKSCGCKAIKNMDAINEWKKINGSPHKKPHGVAAFNNVYNQYKGSARAKGLDFSISKEEFKEITQKCCFYCGSQPAKTTNWNTLNGNYTYNGIDRKNNNLGYVSENCLPCCSECNYLKRSSDFEEFVARIHKISENLKNEKKS